MTLQKVSLPFLLISLFVLPAVASAAVSQTIPQGSVPTTATVVADVYLTDVVATEKSGTFSGTFALQGNMGLQGDIVYGVVITDSKGALLSATKLGDATAIQEGAIKTYPFSYTLPAYLKGEATVLLVAETTGGLRLSTHILAKRTFAGPGSNTTCSLTAPTTIGCTFAKAGSATVSLRNALFATSDLKSEVLTGTAGAKKSYEVTGAPGIYYAFVTEGSAVTHVLPLRVPGEFGSFANVAVSSEKEGEVTITATYLASPSKGVMLAYSLTDGAGKVCASGSEAGDPSDAVVTVSSSCEEGVVAVKLMAPSGATLVEKSVPFSVLRYEPPTSISGSRATTGISAGWVALVLLLVSLNILALLSVRLTPHRIASTGSTYSPMGTQHQAPQESGSPTNLPGSGSGPVIGLLLLIAFFATAPSASALTLSAATWLSGENYVVCRVDSTPDASAYKPGATMRLTSNIMGFYDAKATPLSNWSCGNYYNGTLALQPKFDMAIWETNPALAGKPMGNTPPLDSVAGFIYATSNNDLTIPSSMSIGDHWLQIRVQNLTTDFATNAAANTWNVGITEGPLNFKVVNVNVQFTIPTGGTGGPGTGGGEIQPGGGGSSSF